MRNSPRDLITLTKPRITLMNVLMAAGGMAMAPGDWDGRLALWAMLGTALAVGSANALNMVWEREGDAFMERTARRPLPAGRMSTAVATAFGLALGLASVAVLYLAVNTLTAVLGLAAIVAYVCVYTPMKRRSAWALVVGAVPGAAPPLMGWAAATGRIDAPAWVLFGVLFVWQLPHFIAISLFRDAEYRRAGIVTVPMVRGDRLARMQAAAWVVLLLPLSVALVPLGAAGIVYLLACLILGGWLAAEGLKGLRPAPPPNWARRFFGTTVVYLTLLGVALVVDHAVLF